MKDLDDNVGNVLLKSSRTEACRGVVKEIRSAVVNRHGLTVKHQTIKMVQPDSAVNAGGRSESTNQLCIWLR